MINQSLPSRHPVESKSADLPMKRVLIAEGMDDLFAVVGLMEHHIPWGNKKKDWPVEIRPANGVEEILNAAYLSAEIKSNQIIGIMLDADEHAEGRYQRLRQLCGKQFPEMPDTQPPAGLVTQNADNKRLGIWIMPDNQSVGYLETFLRYLVPDSQLPLWQHAEHAVKEAVSLGAGCKDGHTPKAHLYTWLAWQDPPGRSPGIALTQKVLDANSGFAQPFVTWFKDLYQLPAK